MDGGTPTKDPPKRGPLVAVRTGSGAVAVVRRTPATGNQKPGQEAEPPDGERRPYAESGKLRRVFRIGATDGRTR